MLRVIMLKAVMPSFIIPNVVMPSVLGLAEWFPLINLIPKSGNPYCKGRISKVDLLVITGSDQLLFILKS
jgi:hypothetical protein